MKDFFATNKAVKIAVISLFALLIIYAIWHKDINAFFQKKVNGNVPDFEKLPGADRRNVIAKLDTAKTLKKGMRGNEVLALQKMLIRDGATLPKYGTDGVFGSETEAALMFVTGKPPLIPKKEVSLADYGKGSWSKGAINTGIGGWINDPTNPANLANGQTPPIVPNTKQAPVKAEVWQN